MITAILTIAAIVATILALLLLAPHMCRLLTRWTPSWVIVRFAGAEGKGRHHSDTWRITPAPRPISAPPARDARPVTLPAIEDVPEIWPATGDILEMSHPARQPEHGSFRLDPYRGKYYMPGWGLSANPQRQSIQSGQ